MGFLTRLRSGSSSRKQEPVQEVSRRSVSNSSNHDYKQVLGFQNSESDGAKAADIRRDLYSMPKPEIKETMADYLAQHKQGDIFPYVAITGQEEETKDARYARLRSVVSAYGKSVKPDMRINGVVLELMEGKIQIQDLKEHVDNHILNKSQIKENKKFKAITEHNFNKPYLRVRRITGEFVPLLSNTADYTDLIFCLQDDRLLENQIVVQSNKIATNATGVFELSCDYCIPTRDIRQLALKYTLARPIMRDGFQWGAVSLTVSIEESDTPYLTAKVEAMAISKTPYTAMEERETDPDHKDITFTAGQIKLMREMYMRGDIVDNDMPLKERLKNSSYSKSSFRGAIKGEKGPEHLGETAGWEMMKGMRKPMLPEGQASISAASDEDEEDQFVTPALTKDQWEENQEKLREEEMMRLRKFSASTQEENANMSDDERVMTISSSGSNNAIPAIESRLEDSDEEFRKIMNRKKKKAVGFAVHDV